VRVLFLTNNFSVVQPLYEWLCAKEGEENVLLLHEPLKYEDFQEELCNVELIVSYNYDFIISKKIIKMYPNRIFNLHISLLPWNRGCSPNLWSFLHDTPKGATIHLIDEGLDTGDILYQSQVVFDENKETLESSYNILHATIQELCIKNWNELKHGNFMPKKQTTCNSKKATHKIIEKYNIRWDEKISDVRQRIKLDPLF